MFLSLDFTKKAIYLDLRLGYFESGFEAAYPKVYQKLFPPRGHQKYLPYLPIPFKRQKDLNFIIV